MTGIVYGQVAGFGFLNYDDNLYVIINRHIVGLTVQNLRWAATGVINSNWQPLVWLSYMFDSQIAGLDPGIFHLTNLMLHIANTLLLLFLLHRMTGSLWRSSFVAALFALHPLHVESVAWVAERKDVLSTLFWLLTILLYVRYVEKPSLGRYVWVPVVFALGLMAKPMLVTLPIILLLLDYWPLGRLQSKQIITQQKPNSNDSTPVPLRQLIMEKVPLLLLSTAVGIVTVITQKSSGAIKELGIFSMGVRTANAVFSYIAYLCKTIWPTNLAPFYPHPENSLPTWEVAGSAILVIAITWFVARSRRHPYALVGWLWYLITLLPVIGLVQVGAQAMADRYTYVPMIGIGIMIAWGIPSIIPQRQYKAIAVLAIGVIAAFSICTYQQVGYWRNDTTLFSHSVEVVKDNFVAHNNLGTVLLLRGKNEAALAHFREAARIEPRCMRAQFNVINLLYIMGDVDGAIKQTYNLLNRFPHEGRAYLRLGIIYLRQSKLDLAEKNIRQALRESPDDPKAHQAMGMLLLKRGKADEAVIRLSEAAKLSPDDTDIRKRLKYAKSLKARKAAD